MNKLQKYIVKGSQKLRLGYTTGTCAAAATQAAVAVLLGKKPVPIVRLTTPAGIILDLEVEDLSMQNESVTCAVQKDAGDDPDVTNGILIYATAKKQSHGIDIVGGTGVGRVTQPGLQCPVGAAAINPVPMQMIRQEIQSMCTRYGYTGGLHVTIFVPKGEKIAQRTYNPRLGIVGGISILGTRGIVEPMSERALIDTIRVEIDAKHARGDQVLLIVPGNYGRDFARKQFGLDIDSGVKISNFIGEALDYAVYRGFQKIVLLGHAGKLIKIAGGIFQTHSSVADARCEILAAHCGLQGCSAQQIYNIMQCITVDAAHSLLDEWGVSGSIWSSIGDKLNQHLQARVGLDVEIEFAAFAATGIVMQSSNLQLLIDTIRKQEARKEEY